LHGNISSRTHGDADVGLGKRRGVPAALPQCSNEWRSRSVCQRGS
jgi:hypothetical protein